MKIISCCLLLFFLAPLPKVFNENMGKLVEENLRREASEKFAHHKLPADKNSWDQYRSQLRDAIIGKTGALIHQQLPLNLKETGSRQLSGFTVKNISFQTRPGTYATANLFIPQGNGKFPGIVVMMGHSPNGRLYDKYQQVGITLALNGYVALCIDPWGSGERTTVHGAFEDHGDDNNLGAFLMDAGETLMGMQITDNIRAVDLLASLPYVDANKIGATGSSGGGNQTMWLTAMDERIKAAVPVVSAGTFESFVMGSPCICEVLPDALTFTEEAGVLALIAPRPLKMCNHSKDANAAFQPREMMRSFSAAKAVFDFKNASQNIAYQLFDLPHGYFPEDRLAMIAWFNQQLKGTNDTSTVTEEQAAPLPYESLLVFPKGSRDSSVTTTATYCRQKGSGLRSAMLQQQKIDADKKKKELAEILRLETAATLKKADKFPASDNWKRFALETSDNKLIPLLLQEPSRKNAPVVIIVDPAGKENIPLKLIDSLKRSGNGIALADLSGTGELSSPNLHSTDSTGRLRTVTKSCLLLGKTLMGEWVNELSLITDFLSSAHPGLSLSVYGYRETGLAALFLKVQNKKISSVTLENAPVSYLFDQREGIEYFSTAVHVPGFLNWGDVSLAAALAGENVHFVSPVSISGRTISADERKNFDNEISGLKQKL